MLVIPPMNIGSGRKATMCLRRCAILQPRNRVFFCCLIWICPDNISDFTNLLRRLFEKPTDSFIKRNDGLIGCEGCLEEMKIFSQGFDISFSNCRPFNFVG